MGNFTLTLTQPHFISSEADFDTKPAAEKMTLPGKVWRSAKALAESQGFRTHRNDYYTGAQTASFVEAVEAALLADIPKARHAHLTVLFQARAFFERMDNRQHLMELLEFLRNGGKLDVIRD